MATETLSVKITADAKSFSSSISSMCSSLNKVSQDFSGLKKVGESMSSVGKKLTAGLTLPIAGIGTVSAKTAMDFEAGMNEVSAISGATGKDLDKLSQLAKDMGSTTKFSATESAEALKYMGKYTCSAIEKSIVRNSGLKLESFKMLINYQSHDKSCEGLETR